MVQLLALQFSAERLALLLLSPLSLPVLSLVVAVGAAARSPMLLLASLVAPSGIFVFRCHSCRQIPRVIIYNKQRISSSHLCMICLVNEVARPRKASVVTYSTTNSSRTLPTTVAFLKTRF